MAARMQQGSRLLFYGQCVFKAIGHGFVPLHQNMFKIILEIGNKL